VHVLDGRGNYARQVRRVRFKLASNIDALALLGKHHKLYIERQRMTGVPALPGAWTRRWRGCPHGRECPFTIKPERPLKKRPALRGRPTSAGDRHVR